MKSLVSRRRLLRTIAGIGALSTVPWLAACGAPAPTPVPAAPASTAAPAKPGAAVAPTPTVAAATKPAAQARVELRYMERGGALGEFMRHWSRIYEEQNPHIVVKNESASWTDLSTKVATSVAAGTMADVAFQHGALMLPELAAKGAWLNVEPIGNDEKHDWNQYYKFALESLRLGPKKELVAMPMGIHTGQNQLIWNEKLIQKAGVAPPNPDMTVDDLTKLTVELKKALPDAWPIMSGLGHWDMEVHARSWKGYIISPDRTKCGFNLPETRAACQFFYDWIHNYKVQPGRQEIQGNQAQMFYGEKLVIAINTAPNIFVGFKDAVGDKFTIADMMWPAKPSGVVGTVPSADANVVYGKSKHPAESWGLVKLLSSFEASKWTAVNPPNMTPGAVIAAWNDADVWKAAPPYKTIAVFLEDLTKKGQEVGTLPVPLNTRRAEFTDLFNNDWQAMAYGEKPFDNNAVAELQTKLQAVMDKPLP